MGRTRDVSKILTSNTSILTLASASSTYQTIAKTGLIEITPPTISVTGGSGSVSTTGVVSFTGASSISINDVFSATYDNYFLAITVDSITTSSQDLLLRLRVGGADNSSNNYRWAGLISFDTITTINALKSSGLTSSFRIGTVYLTTNTSFTGVTMVNPFRTEETGYSTTSVEYDGTNSVMRTLSGVTSVTTSYTGFTILPAANNITGKVSVYGYNQ